MKRSKICALVLSACMALGAFAACDDPNATTTTTTTAESSASESVSDSSIVFTDESSATSESTEAKAEKIVFEGDAQTNANTFITNFTEIYFANYSKETATLERYLDFAHIHFKVNSQDKIKYENLDGGDYETIAFADILSTVGKYFNVGVSEDECKKLPSPSKDVQGPAYKDGRVWFHGGAGESYSSIGIVDYALNTGDGNLTLVFTIYQIKWEVYNELRDDDIKKYYKLTPEKAAADNTLEKVGTGTAYVGVGQSDGYFLLDYKTEAA